jgi:peptidoglycan/xylan/chitin deacetylase (PgdA/CDA1 family)
MRETARSSDFATGTSQSLSQGINLTVTELDAWLTQTNSLADLNLAFGTEWNRYKAAKILKNWRQGNNLPKIQVVTADLIHGARGAFDSSNGSIYINQDFLAQNCQNYSAISAVILEELGHYLDSTINTSDSPGDEGAVFAKLVKREAMTSQELASLQAEDDHTQTTIQGKNHNLELAGTYGNITVDGNLIDWTTNDRLDVDPAVQQTGQEVYGKYAGNNYIFALKSDRAIGTNTTFWLNTDQNRATGYQIWGFAGGAEYNISIGADGKANLYSGAERQTLVAALDYAKSADGKSFEVAVPITQLAGNPQNIDLLADINDQVYLPGDYDQYKYTVSAATVTPKTTYGNINLDGRLADWQASDRIDTTGGQTGYEIYGKYTTDGYVLALKSAVAIGANTTFWLNTDRNDATGYKIFGFANGSEYNINIAADGKAYLYTGAAGQTLVGRLDFAKSADGKTLEVAIPNSTFGTSIPQGIDIQADVNNQIYLPTDYSLYKYTILQNSGTTAPKTTYGDITLNGSLSDWSASNRLDYLPSTQVAGQTLYGKNTADGYVFVIQSDRVIGANTTIWLNTDQNTQTGYKIWGFAGGAEYNINIGADGQAYLYTGNAGQTLVGKLDSAKSADGKTIEIGVAKSLLTTTSPGIDILADVNDQVYIPGDYSTTKYTVSSGSSSPVRTDLSKKIAIVYSETSANKYFDKKAYTQLIMNAQNQAMMAGIPFDVINESDLTNLNKLINYDTIVFPSFINVQKSQVDVISQTLGDAVLKYNVGLVAAGDFMTNDETGVALAGDPYARMKNLLGVAPSQTLGVAAATITAKDTTSPVFQQAYTAGQTIDNFAQLFVTGYSPTNATTSKVVAETTANGQKYNAVLQTTTGGRNVHFSDPSLFANTNLAWQALQWSTYNTQPKVSLHMGRENSIFVGRNDVDQSQYDYEASIVEGRLTPILQEWKQKYNFVGSNYINIGNNPAQGEFTDWAKMKPIYQQWLNLGHEIATHSYTHPDNVNNLTAAQLEFEFNQSKQIISQQLGINVIGTATPGNPNNLFVDNELKKYFQYISGVGAAYDNAIGYLEPGGNTVFINPNTSFDFTLIGFRKLTPTQADAVWAEEYKNLKTNANQPIIMMSWHDYGPTQFEPGYTKTMFDNFLSRSYNDGTEFVTMQDLQQRIKTFDNAQITVNQTGNTITANVASNDVGKFGLDVGNGQKIQSVTNWYAYDDNTVFLPKNGGNFTISLGATPTNVTRISKLPMRGELVSLTGNGQDLSYTFNGEGKVTITLATVAGKVPVIRGADSATISGNQLVMTFNKNGSYTGTITYQAGTTPQIINNTTTALLRTATLATAADTLTGTVPAGTLLTTTSGADTFVLGDADRVYYNDGNPETFGLQDYGVIQNFSIAQGDVIQLKGKGSDYQIIDSPLGVGKAIYYKPAIALSGVTGMEALDTKGELIGVVENGDLNLSLTDSYFKFV